MSISTPILRTAFVQRSTAMSNALFIFGGAIFLAVLAQISIPVPGSPVPVTGQTLAVLLIGTTYGARLGFITAIPGVYQVEPAILMKVSNKPQSAKAWKKLE